MRTLASRDIVVREEITLGGEPGNQFIKRGGVYLCGDDPDAKVRAFDFAIAAGDLTGKSVAWIGGGMCVGPRLFAVQNCTQTVFEIEPALGEFCPQGVAFIPGDWHTALTGRFDLIIWDIDDDPPYGLLNPHLNRGGKVIPVDLNVVKTDVIDEGV